MGSGSPVGERSLGAVQIKQLHIDIISESRYDFVELFPERIRSFTIAHHIALLWAMRGIKDLFSPFRLPANCSRDAVALLVDSLQKQEDGRRENRRVGAGYYPTIPSWGYRAPQPEREIPLQTRCRSSGRRFQTQPLIAASRDLQQRSRGRRKASLLALRLVAHHFVIIPQPAAPRV
jgi:hypothetical protein